MYIFDTVNSFICERHVNGFRVRLVIIFQGCGDGLG